MSVLKIKNGSTWEEIPAGGVGVPSGGTTGQVLLQSSATDYATEWGNYFPTIVEDVWDTTQGGAANFDSTGTFEVSGSGFVLVQDNTWIDPLSASDYGSTNVTITYNGAVVASAGVRTTSTHSEMQGAYVEYPANVSNGDTFVLNERHTKGGTKHVRRRFVCFGCTVTKTA